MSRVFVHGLGAVSPAGWGVTSMREALEKNQPVPAKDLARPGWTTPLKIRGVPPPTERPAFATHARLRRAGDMAHHTVAAALETLGPGAAPARLGIIVSMLAGLVAYTRRFYEQVLKDPATASPLLFPETVFNAPASHLAAYLGSTAPNYTLVGDDGMFVQGLGLAAQWLIDGEVDGCLVIGVEELDWLVPNALRLFYRDDVYSSGAGAIYLTRKAEGALAELATVTNSISFTMKQGRDAAARKARAELPEQGADELLCSSTRHLPKRDDPENAAWESWTGARLTPRAILGEAFAASAAWQCVAACDALSRRAFKAANVSVVGASQQAIGARFIAI